MFFNNYSKPGKGVNKRDPNQPRWQIFFDVFPRKLWDLFKLNILYLLAGLPFFIVTMIISGIISSPIIDEVVVLKFADINFLKYDILLRSAFSFLFMGLGPATAGFAYIIREHANEHPCMLVSDFFERFKLNFKQSILLWITDLIVFYVFSVAIGFYGRIGNIVIQYVFMVVSVIYIMMHIYIYQMIVTFDLSLKDIFKNSLLIALGKTPISLLILGYNAVLYIIIPIYTLMHAESMLVILILVFAEIFIFPPITCFITNFCIIQVLKKYVISI